MDEQNNNVSSDDKEWEEALNTFSTDAGVDVKKDGDEQKPATEVNGDPKPEDEKKDELDDDKKNEDDSENETEEQPTSSKIVREQRSIQRTIQAERDDIRNDIAEKLSSDVSDDILDSEGKPIKTIEEVMSYRNPKTNEAFTEEEAAQWLLDSQRVKNEQKAAREALIDAAAETNISLKDQADTINEEFGDLLRALPNLRAEIWDAFLKTLERDEASDIIIKAPVSMEQFYRVSLRGYVELAKKLKAEHENTNNTDVTNPTQTNPAPVKTDRSDRDDIVSRGQSDTRSDEDKEWSDVMNNYYKG